MERIAPSLELAIAITAAERDNAAARPHCLAAGSKIIRTPLDWIAPKEYMTLMTREAKAILRKLRSHRSELQDMGAEHLALFGSYATGKQTAASDIDIGIKFNEAKRGVGMDYFGLRGEFQERLSEILDGEVHLSDEDSHTPAVREDYLADRLYAF